MIISNDGIQFIKREEGCPPHAKTTTSNDGIQFIKREEGCILHVYKDPVGKDTIGTGHLVQPGENWPEKITEEQAEALLKTDLTRFENNLNKQVRVTLTQYEFDALVSLTFNIGTNGFNKSAVLTYLNIGNKEAAADAMLAWNQGTVNGKKRALPVLIGRRNRERDLFLTGNYR